MDTASGAVYLPGCTNLPTFDGRVRAAKLISGTAALAFAVGLVLQT